MLEGFALGRFCIGDEGHSSDTHGADPPEPYRKRARKTGGRGSCENTAAQPTDDEQNGVALWLSSCCEHCQEGDRPNGQARPREQWNSRRVKKPHESADGDEREDKHRRDSSYG